MNCARNYENVLNVVKVMPKILLVPFFRTRCRAHAVAENLVTEGPHTYFL